MGRFDVFIGEKRVEPTQWRLSKASTLVKILALHPGHRLHRDEITELLWPGVDSDAGRNNFHRTLHAARRALSSPIHLADADVLRLSRGILDLHAGKPVSTDVEIFENEAAFAMRCSSIESFESALQLYSGELLPDDRYEDWAHSKRTTLCDLVKDLHTRLARSYQDQRKIEHAAEHFRQAIAFEPGDEHLQVEFMRALALAGRRHRALRQFQEVREVLRREFDDEPGVEITNLYEAILSGQFPETAPVEIDPVAQVAASSSRKPEAIRHNNLPIVLTSFVGRVSELQKVTALLSVHRLVTVTGAGGIGKTRLALEVGSQTLHDYPDGVWLVELATAIEPMLIEQSLCDSLGISDPAAEPSVESIADSIASRELLLILDNCEHLVERTAEIVDFLLRHCPSLRILATSRVPLRVPGELVRQVPPMESSTADNVELPSSLESEAVRLFVHRAQLRDPLFRPKDCDVQDLSWICERLGGMPLAIELAAARVQILSPAQIAERLDDVLPLLSDSPRTVPARQRTMEAAIDWTYERMPQEVQWLFRQMSVFVGGVSAEAVEAVAAGSSLPTGQSPYDLLRQLIEHSLVMAEDAGRDVRYRAPEPIRQYGIRLLERHGELSTVLALHADWCVHLAEHASQALEKSIDQETLTALDHELSNLRAAMSWSLSDETESSTGLRIAAALWRYWEVRGLFSEGRTWLTRALERSSDAPRVLHARALRAAGNLARNHGDFAAAIRYHGESLALRRQLCDTHGEAAALNNLGAAHRDLGEYDRTIELCTESLELYRRVEDEQGAAISLINLGMANREQGNLERAFRCYHESLIVFRRRSDKRHIAAVLNYLAQIAVQQDDAGVARAYASESLDLNREVRDSWGEALALMSLGSILDHEGEHSEAVRVYAESLDILHRLGILHHVAQCLVCLARGSHHMGDSATAVRLLGAAQAIRETTGTDILPSDRPDYEQLLASLQNDLSEDEFEALWASGWAMTQERAVDFALNHFTGA